MAEKIINFIYELHYPIYPLVRISRSVPKHLEHGHDIVQQFSMPILSKLCTKFTERHFTPRIRGDNKETFTHVSEWRIMKKMMWNPF